MSVNTCGVKGCMSDHGTGGVLIGAVKSVDTTSVVPTASELAEVSKSVKRAAAIKDLRSAAEKGYFFFVASNLKDWFLSELVSKGFKVKKIAERGTHEDRRVDAGDYVIEW
jgi:hypothetical protein